MCGSELFKQTFSFIWKNKSTLEEFLWGFNVERFLEKVNFFSLKKYEKILELLRFGW